MKKIHLLAVIASVMACSGCSFHSLTRSPISNSPSVILEQNNFHVVKHVSSSASCTYVFGIGGMSQKALRQNAIADMMLKANLTGSQTVINITSKVSRKMVTPIYVRTTVSVHGTVIQYDSPNYVNTVELTNVDKDKVYEQKDYGYAATSPMGLVQSGDINDLKPKEQKAMLEMLVEELGNDLLRARDINELQEVKKSIDLVKSTYHLMSKSMRKEITALQSKVDKKIARLSKNVEKK